ncbi:hypothetical protein AAFF_G00424550 [Aldrovandia affinis]|uniref:Uncharacterized protein n=1 Tax=Aldrovandia affinis TaxID=143900 RepID=A0AAD7T6Y4_9TELE|nr:hypothetical protein AAFF_G00424550 [Aldrovandia affinis]
MWKDLLLETCWTSVTGQWHLLYDSLARTVHRVAACCWSHQLPREEGCLFVWQSGKCASVSAVHPLLQPTPVASAQLSLPGSGEPEPVILEEFQSRLGSLSVVY